MENNFNEEQKKVFSTIEKMVAAFEKKIDGVLATYETNAIVMLEPQKPVQEKEALRSVFTQFVSMNPQYTFSGHVRLLLVILFMEINAA
jgi:ketosteroid isomerase-like protein